MFGDQYVEKIGAVTEIEAKVALSRFLYGQYRVQTGADSERSSALAAAVTNRVFGEVATGDKGMTFAAENSVLIHNDARKLASDEHLCSILSGAAYNAGYARYIRSGGRRGVFANQFLTYIRSLSRDDSYREIRDKARDGIVRLGTNILAPIESMQELGIFRPLPDNPNERQYYDAVHQFAVDSGVPFK